MPLLEYYFYKEGTLESALLGLGVDVDALLAEVSGVVAFVGCSCTDVSDVKST